MRSLATSIAAEATEGATERQDNDRSFGYVSALPALHEQSFGAFEIA